ncbi:MAG: hypothetical protein HOH20_07575 [Rhodospirillaceae bacterium]|jgi:hypothetical protein|nr:hypothetical protein [Rhodospirillaceae bacterium]
MMAPYRLLVSSFFVFIMAADGASAADGQATITETFCTSIQTSIMGNKVPAQNVVHPDYEAFVLSKASVDPLRNEQFTTLGDDGLPRMVSCKMKTPDHIQEVYGEDKTNTEARTCAAINQENVAAVIASLTPEEAEKRALTDVQIIFEEDMSDMTGQSWTKPFDFATRDKNGAVHIQSKRMQIDWTNIIFKLAPDRFRGALYCHLIAPEFAKALILGDADVPPPVDG